MYSEIKLISKASQEINKLTKIQKLVCKIFKIKAEKTYELTIEFECKDEKLRVSDIVLIPLTNIRMYILSKNEGGVLTAKSMNLLTYIPETIGCKLLRLGSAF